MRRGEGHLKFTGGNPSGRRGYVCGSCPPSSACQAGHVSTFRFYTPPVVGPQGAGLGTLGTWGLDIGGWPLKANLSE